MKVYNKFVESKKEPQNKNDIWFDGEVFNIYKEGKWQAFTLELDAANKVKQIIDNASNVYQEKLTAGKGIIIENNTISTEKFFQIVDKLPTKGEHNTIYLLTSKNKEDGNTLIEYIWLDNRWEQLGEFKADVDLSPYVTKEEFQEAFDELGSFLDEGFTELSEGIGKKADKDGVYSELTAGDLAGRGESVPAEFGFRASGGKSIKDGRAYIKRIKGNSVVWNQLRGVYNVSRTDSKANVSLILTKDSNIIRLRGIYDGTIGDLSFYIQSDISNAKGIIGHKYMCVPNGLKNAVYTIFGAINNSITYLKDATIVTCVKEDTIKIVPRLDDRLSEGTEYNEDISFSCVDLTKMFGAGNEPTTIEDFNARVATLGVDMDAYNEGQVIHMNTESIKSVGDNAWDEEWRNGHYSTLSGIFNGVSKSVANVNPIKILPNSTYVCNKSIGKYFESYVFFYDDKMNFILYKSMGNGTFTSPSNAVYMNFYVSKSGYGSVYNHDITISLYHSGWKAEVDSTYKPYWQDTLPLPIISQYFPNGMKSAGSAHDEIRYNKESGKWEMVEAIGTRAYQEGDADNASYLTDGKVTCYPLAKPIVTELDAEDQNFRDYYNVADFGTEMSQSSVPSAPFSADIIYQFNAVDMIREHELEITELQNVIATMQAQLASLTSNH